MSFMPIPPSYELLRTGNVTGGAGLGGGLGSSPNVPKPGTSVDPSTGQLHSEGLTRAELQQKKAEAAAIERANGIAIPVPTVTEIPPESTVGLTAEEVEHIKSKGQELLDAAPQTEVVRRGSIAPDESKLAQKGREELAALNGREQAARQLTATAPQSHTGGSLESGAITPGLELPGAWGPVHPTGFPGSGPGAPTSIYEDLSEGLNKVGQAAFAAIPSPIKEAFHQQSAQPIRDALSSPSAKGPTSPRVRPADGSVPTSPRLNFKTPDSPPVGSAAGARRGSAVSILEQARQKANMVVHDVQETLQQTGRRASMTVNESPLLGQIKSFAKEAFVPIAGQQAHLGIGPIATAGRGTPVVAIAPRTSLPSAEPAGALPGEHSSGVGALPGSSNESGVAILPDERKPAQSLPSHENQGFLPGETSGGIGVISDKVDESEVAVLPSERAVDPHSEPDSVAGPSGTSGLSDAVPSAPTSGLDYDAAPSAPEATVPSFEEAVEPEAGPILVAPEENVTAPQTITPAEEPIEATKVPAPVREETTPIRNSGAYTGLAAALPATFLGAGADKGATDIKTVLTGNGPEIGDGETGTGTGSEFGTDVSTPAYMETATPSNFDETPLNTDDTPVAVPVAAAPDTFAPSTHHGIDRADSSSSVTAIRGGHEGQMGSSKLHQSTLPPTEEIVAPTSSSELDNDDDAEIGQKSTTRGTGPNHTQSLTPGDEVDGVGHPSSRDVEGTSREPGQYPTVDHTSSTAKGENHTLAEAAPTPKPDTTKSAFGPNTSNEPLPTTVTPPAAKQSLIASSPLTDSHSKSTSANQSPTSTPTIAATGTGSGHERTASGSSNVNGSKRKSGIFGKIKDKLKHKD